MNDSGSIVEFFYNIIPGSLFLIALKAYYNFDILSKLKIDTGKEALTIFAYIILGLSLGFLFQCITKLIRSWGVNRIAFLLVRNNKNNITEFDKVCKNILGNNYKRLTNVDLNKVFYLMDNYLRGKEPAFLPTHFSSRFAFWANIFWGTLVLICLSSFLHHTVDLTIWLVGILIFSFWMAGSHLINFYDTILKSYYMLKIQK